jgi:peptidoglycan/xylan/chitin deacetylase (PgdA/CDA1 family)
VITQQPSLEFHGIDEETRVTTYIWSIDDAGLGRDSEIMRRTCQVFDSHGVKSTWFVVPKPNGSPLSPAWLEVLAAIRDTGHDIQLHGLTHADCYEFGPPAWPAITILPTMQPEFDRRREELLPRYTLEKLQARLEEGIDIFETQLGVHPTAFRAPCGAISKPLFTALRNVGIDYHSVMYISGTGYNHLPHNSGVLEPEWVDTIPHQPFIWYDGVIEAPILGEYTWSGSGRRSAEFIQLARQDIQRIAQESPFAVILMHTHGIANDPEHAFRLIAAVVEQVGQLGGAFATFAEVIANGSLAAAATEQGPDLLAL